MGKDLTGKELGRCFGQLVCGLYFYRYKDERKQRKTIYENDINDLKKYVDDHNLDFNKRISDANITINELFEEAYDNEYIKVYKHMTKSYKKYIQNSFGKKKLSTLTYRKIADFYDSIAKNYCQTVCSSVEKCMDAAFFMGVQKNMIHLDNVPDFTIVSDKVTKSNKKSNEFRTLTKEEQQYFEQYSNKSFYKDFYVFLLNTGLRFNEAAGITLDCIDFKNKTVLINRSITKSTKNDQFNISFPKYDYIRRIPLNDQAVQVIDNQLKKHYMHRMFGEDGEVIFNSVFDALLFYSETGSPLSSKEINRDLNSIIKDINQNENIHIKPIGSSTLRNTFVANCIEMNYLFEDINFLIGERKDKYVSEIAKNIGVLVVN